MNERKFSSTNVLNETYLSERCILNKLLSLIGSRWSSEILLLIHNKTNRFTEIKASLNGISDTVLADRLTVLIEAGFLRKKVFKEVPLRVEYQLTKSGKELMKHLQDLCDWARERLE